MADLFNNFPSWGETGAYPTAGFFYEGGDQVNEKHMDALWNGVKTHIDNLNTGIRDRVRDITGDVVLDQGLIASAGAATREVDVSASSAGAYVDGQKTGSTSATTLTHTANGGASTRTDVVWVNTNGSVGKTEGTTTPSNDRMKLAEVDVATDDTISAIRNTARDHRFLIASETQPSTGEPGDLWQDLTNKRENVYQNGDWRTLITEQDNVTFNANDGLDGGGSFDPVDGYTVDFDVDVSDLLGTGVTEDGSNNLELDESVIKDGGAKEIDAQEFAGSDGTNGEVLFTDGTNAFWSQPPDTRTDVSDNGSLVVTDTLDINFESNLSASDDGDGTTTVSVVDGSGSGLDADTLDGNESSAYEPIAPANGSEFVEHSLGRNNQSPRTLIDVNQSGEFYGGIVANEFAGSETDLQATYTIDGEQSFTLNCAWEAFNDKGHISLIPVKFDSSLTIEISSFDYFTAQGWASV